MGAPLAKASRTPVTSFGGLHVDPIRAPTTKPLDAAEPTSRAVIKRQPGRVRAKRRAASAPTPGVTPYASVDGNPLRSTPRKDIA